MIHPLFTQYNEDLGDRLNAGRPSDDFGTYGKTVIKAVAGAKGNLPVVMYYHGGGWVLGEQKHA